MGIVAAPALEARFETLVRVSQLIGAHRDPKDLFNALADELHGVVQFDHVGVSVLDRDSAIWHDYFLDMESRSALVLEDGMVREETLTWWVYEHQEPLLTSTDDVNPPNEWLHAKLKRRHIRSICTLPLTTAHRKLGAISFCSKQLDGYSPQELPFLSIVAGQIAQAFDNALNFRELQNKNGRLELLLDLTNGLVSKLELRDLLRNISGAVRRILHCDVVGVVLPDTNGKELRVQGLDFAESKGFLGTVIREEMTVPWQSESGVVYRTGRPLLLQGENQPSPVNPDYDFRSLEGIKCSCLLPLVTREHVLGVMGVSRRTDTHFSDDEVNVLTQVANQIALAVENALAYSEIRELKDQLSKEKLYLEDEIRSEMNFAQIIGGSASLRRVLKRVETVAPTDSTVLIHGETGTGKELVARAIHDLSPRRSKPFVKLNCAAIPTGLLESELFGYEKGAFTGAIAQRIGRFEVANGGTIFLDEVGEIPLELQTKLLRVLQEREFERLGSSRTLHTDARLIAATNRDLEAMVSEQKFRSDLFFRLSVFPVHVPPLRERDEDIPLLVRHFTQQFSRRMNKVMETIPSAAMDALCRYHWPGNIRELQNVIERAVIISAGPVLGFDVGDLEFSKGSDAKERTAVSKSATNGALGDILKETQREQILKALEECNWVVAGPDGAAVRLGMKRSTLHLRMQKLGISRRWG
ncbi:MAG TPA: sigma 54-interacting transcriptional regulator [Candidatus Acidoferrum sp.]